MNPIKRYLKKHEMNQRQFAELTDTTESQVSSWARGARTPSLAEAFRLEHATKGAIPASSWLNGKRAA